MQLVTQRSDDLLPRLVLVAMIFQFQGCHHALGKSADFQMQSLPNLALRILPVAFICQADTNNRFVVGIATISEYRTTAGYCIITTGRVINCDNFHLLFHTTERWK